VASGCSSGRSLAHLRKNNGSSSATITGTGRELMNGKLETYSVLPHFLLIYYQICQIFFKLFYQRHINSFLPNLPDNIFFLQYLWMIRRCEQNNCHRTRDRILNGFATGTLKLTSGRVLEHGMTAGSAKFGFPVPAEKWISLGQWSRPGTNVIKPLRRFQ